MIYLIDFENLHSAGLKGINAISFTVNTQVC